jgi:hypothetical protein
VDKDTNIENDMVEIAVIQLGTNDLKKTKCDANSVSSTSQLPLLKLDNIFLI